MKIDVVLGILKYWGIELDRTSLLRYERSGLIPAATRENRGRGTGKSTDFPSGTIEQAAASWSCIHYAKMRIEEVATVRTVVLSGDIPEDKSDPQYEGSMNWLVALGLAKTNLAIMRPQINPYHIEKINIQSGQEPIEVIHSAIQNRQAVKCPDNPLSVVIELFQDQNGGIITAVKTYYETDFRIVKSDELTAGCLMYLKLCKK